MRRSIATLGTETNTFASFPTGLDDFRRGFWVENASVDSVPGPNNRLDQQPGGTANMGADYRVPGWPLTMGGNVNLTPGFTTRLSESQWLIQSAKRVVDAYVLWSINPDFRVRVTASNLLQEDSMSTSVVADESAFSTAPTFVNWRVQVEIKL